MRRSRSKVDPFPKAWFDRDTLFTRQEIAERTGLSGDVLSFWSKRKPPLLVAAEGGEGKGSHRRYHFSQVNIAAIYAVFRDHFGANIATLASLGDLLQRSVKAFQSATMTPSAWDDAACIAQALHDFRSGQPVPVRAHDYNEPGYDDLDFEEQRRGRPALNEAEIIAEHITLNTDAPANVLLKFAEGLGPGRYQEARIAQVLLGSVLDPGYMSDVSWLLRQTEAGWEIRESGEDMNFSNVNSDEFGPAVFVPVGAILRKIWGIPTWKELRKAETARECQELFERLGLKATVKPGEEDGYNVTVEAPVAQWPIVEPLLKEHALYYTLIDPAQPGDAEAVK